MKETPLRVGVVGVGNMGRNHLRVLSSMGEYELVGCFDTNREACIEQAAQYQITAFEKQDDLFSNVDVASIAVPSSLHRTSAVSAAKAGRHILVEKPIALSIEDADAIIMACNEAQVKLCVGHIERYNPAVTTLQNVLARENILTATFERMSPPVPRIFDTSVVEDLMIHDIDVLLSLNHSPIKRITSHGVKIYSDSLDYVQALIAFENGVLASLTASRITEAKIRTARISAERSFISVDYLNRTVEISRKTNFSLDVGYAIQYTQENIIEKIMVPITEPLRAEFEHFAQCINYNRKVATNGETAKQALLVCQQIQDIALEG